jgi:phenol 2-monooxygenase
VNDLGAWLSADVLPRFPPIALSPGSDPHGGTTKFKTDRDPSVIDVLLVHTAKRVEVEMLRDLHEVYHPFDSKLGWDYDKVFVDEESYHHGHGKAYEGYGVDPQTGALVIVRPDGYVGLVTSIGQEGWHEVTKWLEGVLRSV